MILTDLPNDILILIFSKYLSLEDLLSASQCCQYLRNLIFQFIINNIIKYPVLDFNYPFGYNEHGKYSKHYSVDYDSYYRLKSYLTLKNSRISNKTIYSFREKMFPTLQIGDETADSHDFRSVYFTDDNQFLWLKLDDILNLDSIDHLDKNKKLNRRKNNLNKIKIVDKIETVGYGDIRKFKKKDNYLIFSFDKGLNLYSFENDKFNMIDEMTEKNSRINCVDMGLKYKRIVYGCTNGFLKIGSMTNFDFSEVNVKDRIIRCSLSPCEKDLAVGTAGIFPYKNSEPCSMRIYDLFHLRERQNLKNPGRIKIGAGVLALSYIDDQTIMSAGYDTFIRIFDLRSNRCVQSLEEPEDMSIYSVCCSKYYGLISGNDRQSIIRYWDRRVNKVIRSFQASSSNSSVYSLACTPDSILAGLDRSIQLIDFRFN